MANKRFIDFPIATTVGDNDIILIWQGGANKQTTKATILSGVPDSLNDLTDVTISGLTNGQILRYDSVTGQWENTDQGNLDLNDLNDVTIVSPTNGQVLIYNSSTSKWENSSGGYVPYVGAVTTVDLGLQGLKAGYVRFDTSIVSVPDEQGLMYWDASRSTVALIMNGTLQHIGQDTFFYVKNSTGSSIPKGTCVRFAGTDGASGHLLITPFLANGSVPSNYFLGVTAETITNGSFGQVMHFGELEGINTSSYTAGALLYASTTVAGAFQTTAPVAPNNIVLVATAVNSKNNGAIVVRPSYGSNINNDEGVKITSPTTGDLLQLQAGGLWENKTIDAAGIVTKATNQTITGVKTFSQDIVVNGVNVGRGGGNRTENTSTGNSALSANTTGSGNTANGSFALFKNTLGGGNTALGTQSLTENTTGSGNTGLGWGSLNKNTSGSNNSALGNLSLYENTTGQTNVGIGFYALFKNTTGSDNTALGYTSGAYIADGSTSNSISNNSVYIGAYTKALANNQTNQIVIGHNAIGGGSNTVVIGNSSILSNRFFGTMRIGTINNGVGDFITTDANGVLTKRTGAEVRTDIGAGTVTSVAALTLGTSGTDLSSTVANGTTTPVITLNVPTASATNRGALSSTDWTTFNNKQNALGYVPVPETRTITINGTTQDLSANRTFNVGDMLLDTIQTVTARKDYNNSTLQLVVNGTSQKTILTNSPIDTGSYSGLINAFGFNASNNLYFSKGGNNNGIFAFSNAATRTYTLKDASGTLAFTSDIPANPVGGTGTTNYLPKFTGTSTIGNSLVFDNGTSVGIGTASPQTVSSGFTLTVGNGATQQQPFLALSRNSLGGFWAGIRWYDGNTIKSVIQEDSDFNLRFSTSNAEAMRIFSGGNVHIGPTPSSDNGARLQVSGAATFSSSVTASRLSLNNSGTAARLQVNGVNSEPIAYLYNNSGTAGSVPGVAIEAGTNSSDYSLSVASSLGTPYLRVRGDGSVGIGTPSPSFQLHVNRAGATGMFVSNTSADTGAYLFAGSNLELQAVNSSNSSVRNLTIQPYGGNVLIGTTTDNGARLQVIGSAFVNPYTSAGTNSSPVFQDALILGPSTNAAKIQFGNEFQSTNGSYIRFQINGTSSTNNPISALTINPSGSVGIGTSSPQSTGNFTHLDVVGKDTSSGGALWVSNSNKTTRGIIYNTNSAVYAGSVTGHDYILITSDIDRFRISSTGSATFSSLGTGTVFSNGGTLTNTNPSDFNLKENIEPINYGLCEILQLNPVTFNWKNDTINQGKQYGFIAQEVQNIMPDLVKKGEYLGLDKEAIFTTLVKAIQELKAEIDTLKN